VRSPRETRLAGLGLCSYNLRFEILRGKVVESRREGDAGRQA
jgi:hypothetical protein